jgi:hypothetical protein
MCVLRYRLEVAVISQHVLAAGVVFTTASDLHDARFLCILAVLATVLTVFFTRTIARGVRALVLILVLSHLNYSPNRWLITSWSTPSLYQVLGNLTHNNCSLALT